MFCCGSKQQTKWITVIFLAYVMHFHVNSSSADQDHGSILLLNCIYVVLRLMFVVFCCTAWNMLLIKVIIYSVCFVTEKSLNCSVKERRKLYACGSSFHMLDDVLTWPQYHKSNRKDVEAYALRGL